MKSRRFRRRRVDGMMGGNGWGRGEMGEENDEIRIEKSLSSSSRYPRTSMQSPMDGTEKEQSSLLGPIVLASALTIAFIVLRNGLASFYFIGFQSICTTSVHNADTLTYVCWSLFALGFPGFLVLLFVMQLSILQNRSIQKIMKTFPIWNPRFLRISSLVFLLAGWFGCIVFLAVIRMKSFGEENTNQSKAFVSIFDIGIMKQVVMEDMPTNIASALRRRIPSKDDDDGAQDLDVRLLIWLICIAPLTEEAVFRWIIPSVLRKSEGISETSIAWISSAYFGAVHLTNLLNPSMFHPSYVLVQVAVAFLLGAFFHAQVERQERFIGESLIIHIINNIMALTVPMGANIWEESPSWVMTTLLMNCAWAFYALSRMKTE